MEKPRFPNYDWWRKTEQVILILAESSAMAPFIYTLF